MVNIFGAGSNQIVIYCDAINDFTYGFFPITITNIFSRETKTFKPDVITKNTRFIKLCFNLVSSQAQEDLSNGKIYIKAQGTFEFQVGNSGTFNTNVSLMNPYRIVEVIEAQVALREQEVQYTSFISENEDLTSYVFLDDDPCPDGNCPPTDCYIPSVGERYGGGLVYQVDTQNRKAFIAGENDIEGLYDWGGFGKQITGLSGASGKPDTAANLAQIGEQGQAADIITGRLIDGYSDWYLPSLIQYQNARSVLGTSLTASNRLYWTTLQASSITQNAPVLNEIYNSTLFSQDYIYWQDTQRDLTYFTDIISFTGYVDCSTPSDIYPEEVSGLDNSVYGVYMYVSNTPGEYAELSITSSVLEPNTFYTFRVYLHPIQDDGDITISFPATKFSSSYVVDPQITLTWVGTTIQYVSSSLLDWEITPLEGLWSRIEVSLQTYNPSTGNLWVRTTPTNNGQDFTWAWVCPTFRKGYFNRHSTFNYPFERIYRTRTYNETDLNPIEKNHLVSINTREIVADSSFINKNASYFTTYTHSYFTTLHAKNPTPEYSKSGLVMSLEAGYLYGYTTGSTWLDNSLNGNNGLLIQNPTYSTSGFFQFGFGATAYVNTNYHKSIAFNGRDPYTLFVDFMAFSASNYPGFIDREGQPIPGVREGFNLIYTQDGLSASQVMILAERWCGGSGVSALFITSSSGFFGSRHKLTATYDGTSIRLYYDGVLMDTKTSTGSISNSSTTLKVGVRNNEMMNGYIYNTRIYNRALTLQEVVDQNAIPDSSTRFVKITTGFDSAYDMDNPFSIVDLDTGRVVKQTTPSTNIIQNNYNINDIRWIKDKVLVAKEYGLDYWSEYTSWLIGTTYSSLSNPQIYYDYPSRDPGESFVFSFYIRPTSIPTTIAISNTSGASVSSIRVNPLTGSFSNITTSPYIQSYRTEMNAFTDWNRVIVNIQIPLFQSSLRTALIPTHGGGGRADIEVCGLQLELGLTATDPIFTDGKTIYYRDNAFTKWTTSGSLSFTTLGGAAPDGTNATRISFTNNITSIVSSPALTGLTYSNTYVYSIFTKSQTSLNFGTFQLFMSGLPAGSSAPGSTFSWEAGAPKSTSSGAKIRETIGGWFQVSHTFTLPASGTISNIKAEIRCIPPLDSAVDFWNPLVELGNTASLLPKNVRRPNTTTTTNMSGDFVRIDNGDTTKTLYNQLDNRLIFSPYKNIKGDSLNSPGATIYVWGAAAVNRNEYTNIYPIENFTFRAGIPQANTPGSTEGFYTSFGYNPIERKHAFYRKDLYFKIKPFREQTY